MRFKTFIICISMLVTCSVAYGDPPGVEYRLGGPKYKRTWDNFYQDAVHEPEIHIPLKKAPKDMTLTICEAVKHSDMKYRRYAIEALGKRKDKRAIPTLESILKNDKEIDYFRGDALEAIYDIDKKLGERYAKDFGNKNSYLRMISDSILEHN